MDTRVFGLIIIMMMLVACSTNDSGVDVVLDTETELIQYQEKYEALSEEYESRIDENNLLKEQIEELNDMVIDLEESVALLSDEVNTEEPAVDDMISNTHNYNKVIMEYSSEGTTYEEDFLKIDNSNYQLLFFIPEQWSFDETESNFITSMRDVGKIEINMYPQDFSDADANIEFAKLYDESWSESNTLVKDWVLKTYEYISFHENRYDRLMLCKYNDLYFTIERELEYEYVEGFLPYETVILENIYYKNNEKLQ